MSLCHRAPQRDTNQGLGIASNTVPEAEDNEYDAYRKRMMLAYRFRPNPLVCTIFTIPINKNSKIVHFLLLFRIIHGELITDPKANH